MQELISNQSISNLYSFLPDLDSSVLSDPTILVVLSDPIILIALEPALRDPIILIVLELALRDPIILIVLELALSDPINFTLVVLSDPVILIVLSDKPIGKTSVHHRYITTTQTCRTQCYEELTRTIDLTDRFNLSLLDLPHKFNTKVIKLSQHVGKLTLFYTVTSFPDAIGADAGNT